MDTTPTPFLDASVDVKNGPPVEGAERVYRKAWAAVGYYEDTLDAAAVSVQRLTAKRARVARELADCDQAIAAANEEVQAVTRELNEARHALAAALQEM